MKKLFAAFLLVSVVACFGQPNTETTIHVTIKSTTVNKTFLAFRDIKSDTTSSELLNHMDYLNPDVTSYQFTLQNIQTFTDSLKADIVIPDSSIQRFMRLGIVRKDNSSQNYSGLALARYKPLNSSELKTWIDLNVIEAEPALIIMFK